MIFQINFPVGFVFLVRNSWPRQLRLPKPVSPKGGLKAITPENHCLGQCLFR